MGNDPSRRQPAVNWNVVGRTRSRRKKSIQMLTIFIDSSTGNWQYTRRFFTASHFNNFFRRNKRPCRRNNSRLFVPKYEKMRPNFSMGGLSMTQSRLSGTGQMRISVRQSVLCQFLFRTRRINGLQVLPMRQDKTRLLDAVIHQVVEPFSSCRLLIRSRLARSIDQRIETY